MFIDFMDIYYATSIFDALLGIGDTEMNLTQFVPKAAYGLGESQTIKRMYIMMKMLVSGSIGCWKKQRKDQMWTLRR